MALVVGAKQRALLFPGQGGHDFQMLDGVRHAIHYAERYALVCDVLHADVSKELANGNQEFLNSNRVSSLLTVLVSCLSLDLYRASSVESGESQSGCFSGYSVGQWTALYAATSLSFETLIKVIEIRAGFMDECFRDIQGGMAAFIGVSSQVLEEYLENIRAQGHYIAISNYNSLGQYSVSGSREAVELAVAGAEAMNVRKAVVLPVQGGWHCDLLEPAEKAFADYLQDLDIKLPDRPVINNSTGDYFNQDMADIKQCLSRHISHPVMWEMGMKRLVDDGYETFVEIGYGDVLTRFGFFIDRDKNFSNFYAG